MLGRLQLTRRRVPTTRSLVIGLTTTLAMIGASVPAGARVVAPSTSPTASTAEDDAVAASRSAFEEGGRRYARSDYAGAIESFSASFDAAMGIADEGIRTRAIHVLRFNLARAHLKSFRIDGQRTHLTTALDLLEKYLGNEAAFGVETEATALIAEVRSLLEENGSASSEASVQDDAENTGEAVESSSAEDSTTAGNPRRGGASPSSLVISGYVSLGLAAAGLGTMGAGMAIAASADETYETTDDGQVLEQARTRGRLGNGLTYAGIGAAAVFGGVGAALLVIGMKKKGQGGKTARWMGAPVLGPGQVGAAFAGRF